MPGLSIGSLAVDPDNPQTIYAGTGEANDNQDGYPGSGVLKSVDGGNNWGLLGASTFAGMSIGRIVVDPGNSNIVLLAASVNRDSLDTRGTLPPSTGLQIDVTGIYRSINGGGTWTLVKNAHGGPSTDVLFDPGDRSHLTVYAAACDQSQFHDTGIYRSTDAGATFTSQVTSPNLPDCRVANPGIDRTSLAISNNGLTFFAVEADAYGNLANGHVYRANNHTGTSWVAVPVPTDMAVDCNDPSGPQGCYAGCPPGSLLCNAPEHQWRYELAVAIDPVHSNIVYIGGVDLWETIDLGKTWAPAGIGSHVHADHHALAFWGSGSEPEFLYDGNDGGIWFGNPASDTFTNLNQGGLNITQFYSGSIGTVGPYNELYGGAQDNGADQYQGKPTGVAQWDEIVPGSLGDSGTVLVDYSNNQIVYIQSEAGTVYKSTDGGSSYTLEKTFTDVNYVLPLVMSPTTPTTLYAGADRVYKSTDGAATWSAPGQPLDQGVSISALAVFAGNDNDVYAGDNSGAIYLSTDGGATWTSKTSPLGGAVRVTGLAVDPVNPNVVYVTFPLFATSCDTGQTACGHVFRSTDAGQTWTDLSINTGSSCQCQLPNIPFESVIVSPIDHNTVILGSDAGVFESPDAGATWLRMGTGLPNTAVDQLFINHSGTQLYAATHGRGMWTIPLVGGGTVYAGADDGYVYAIDITTGAARWATQPPGVSSDHGGLGSQALALDEGAIFAGTPAQDLVSVSASVGVVGIQLPVQGIMTWSSPVTANGTVFIGTQDGIEYAISESDGAVIWQYATGSHMGYGDGIQGSTVVNGVVYFATENGTVYALDAHFGTLIWSHSTSQFGIAGFPAYWNGMLYVGSRDGNVYALNASTGASIWSSYTGSTVQSSVAVATVTVNGAATGMVYAGNNAGVVALDASTGAQLWSYATPGFVVSSPAVANGAVYFGSANSSAASNYVYALDAASGSVIWQASVPKEVECSPLVADGIVFVGDSRGLASPQLYALSVTSGAVLWSYMTAHGGGILGKPVLGA